jgi:excisionase family DNA binding protein
VTALDLEALICAACGRSIAEHRRDDGRSISCRGVAPTASSPWMSANECAAYLGLSRDSLYQAIRRRGLPASRIGRRLRFHKTFVDEWVTTGVDPRATSRLRLARAR